MHSGLEAKYYWNDTLEGEFEEIVFISVDTKYLPIVSAIPEDFVQEFIANKLEIFESSDFSEIDWPLLLKYGFHISDSSKKEMIRNMWVYLTECVARIREKVLM